MNKKVRNDNFESLHISKVPTRYQMATKQTKSQKWLKLTIKMTQNENDYNIFDNSLILNNSLNLRRSSIN